MLSYSAAVVFVALALIACGNSAGGRSEIFGVYAQDVYVEYDGNAHGITVNNVLDDDKIFYKTAESEAWSDVAPSYIIPGVYEVEYKVERNGCNALVGSAKITIAKGVLKGITAIDETVICDGLAHGITLKGLQSTDVIAYSINGIDFSSDMPTASEVGEYTIYFVVERGYSEYRGSCVLEILPNISGRYLNGTYGVIELASTYGTVNGERLALEYDGTATGKLGEYEFQLSNGILSYKGAEYSKLEADDTVYSINVNGERLYFTEEDSVEKLTVQIKSSGAEIAYNGRVIKTVVGVNYCETGIITDYVDLAFEIRLEQSETEIELSARKRQDKKDLTEIVVYDGQAHGLGLGAEYVFLTARESHVEVGKYTATVAEVHDGFLPEVRAATLVILPDITGVYADGTTVIQITEECATRNFIELELNKTVDGWTVDGKTVVVTPDGIELDGIAYTRVLNRALLIEVGDITRTAEFAWELNFFMSVRNTDGVIVVEYGGMVIAEIPYISGEMTVTASGVAAPLTELNGVPSFIIGASELDRPVVHLIITVE